MSLSRDATQIDEENILATQTRLPGLTSPAQHKTKQLLILSQLQPPGPLVWPGLQIMQHLEMVARSGINLIILREREGESLLEIIGRDHCGYL